VPLAIIGVNHVRKIVRLSIAIGGFLIVTSLILTGAVFLAIFNIINPSDFADPLSISLLALAFLAIGVADVIAGIILLKKW
jgi:hypothetical protein